MSTISEIDPKTLVDTRIQLHWAAQILSSAADATLEKAPDDSHSNLGWNSTTNRLDARGGTSLDVVEFKVIHDNDTLDLHGQSLDQGLRWLGERLGVELRPRDYDMPDHGVSSGAVFEPNDEHLKAIADWYTFGASVLEEQGELRVWPHHFDLGFFQPGLGEGKSLGGGFTAGDQHYPLPYIYINPYGIDPPDQLPALETGYWSDKWFGAVITAQEFNAADGNSIARSFTDNAVLLCKQLIAEA